MAVYVTLYGGLANQMCQYAAAWKLANSIGTKVICDLSFLSGQHPAQGYSVREYGLHKLADRPEVCHIVPPTAERLPWEVNTLPEQSSYGDYALQGYFQNLDALPSWNQIQALFNTPKTTKFLAYNHVNNVPGTTDLGIHVRRGDYVTNPGANAFHGVLPLEYYKNALERLQKPYNAFLFSDDVAWCREHLEPIIAADPACGRIIFAEDLVTDDFEQWYLMSWMDSIIMANSSYSWLAALCSPADDQDIYYPAIWFAGGDKPGNRFKPDWIKVSW
jgi:hypothetical protein